MSATVGVPASITAPDRVPSRHGTLEFNDCALRPDTAGRPCAHELVPPVSRARRTGRPR
jgi:hypothetical protein